MTGSGEGRKAKSWGASPGAPPARRDYARPNDLGKGMVMKPLVLATAVSFALIVPSASAYPLGHYTGQTSQGLPLSFDAGTQLIRAGRHFRTIRVIRHFKLRINDFCGSPTNFDTPNYNFSRGYLRVSAGANFAVTLGPRLEPLKWTGHLTGGRRTGSASGTVNDVTFDDDDEVYCRSGSLTWSAHHP